MEFIQTIQGEGINVGKPVIIVRFDNCNCRCEWCDSKQASLSKEETSFEVITTKINNIKNKYPNIDTLLITGGEPLYNKRFMEVVKTQQDMNLEIETNGTLLKNIFNNNRNYKYFEDNIQLNISPKFNVDAHKDIDSLQEVYTLYKTQFKIMMDTGFEEYTVKFVYGDYLDNCDNIILSFMIMNNIPKEKVCIMPFTPDQNDFTPRHSEFLNMFNISAKQTIDFCLKHGFRYSPREHITLCVK